MEIGADVLNDYNRASSLEWIETNGLGGWASSTVLGVNTRRYHGLLVSAIRPPVERMVMLSRLDETIQIDNGRYELATRAFPGTINPEGYKYLKNFARYPFPVFQYSIPHESGEIVLRKTIAMLHGKNTTIVTYEIIKSPGEIRLELEPFVAARHYHQLAHANDNLNMEVNFSEDLLRVRPYPDLPEIMLSVPSSRFEINPDWYYRFQYPCEQSRGLDFEEDLFLYGRFYLNLRQHDRIGIIISTDDISERDAFKLLSAEKHRRSNGFMNLPVNDEFSQSMVFAADQFIVERENGGKSVIAGYHWFADWGRDTMIALPGLTLVTGRYKDAKDILKTFASHVSEGMLPNQFPDEGEKPEYNTVDATLWFFTAIYKYLLYTKDLPFVKKEMLPILLDIVSWHRRGTRFGINVDGDGLLHAGEAGQQLTWMDARIDGWVVTPRHGKPVEVNALWYNALCIVGELLERIGKSKDSKRFIADAATVKKAYVNSFWNEQGGYLYDVVDEEFKDASIRPNQIFALSLEFPMLPQKKARSVLRIIEQHLLTPFGLRSLSQNHPDYRGRYQGDPLTRDSSYHQGTVWSWLLGPYLSALIRYGGNDAKRRAEDLIQAFQLHLKDSGMGTVSEIFDGDEPHTPRGCIAQAWSVAEILRAWVEDVQGIKWSR